MKSIKPGRGPSGMSFAGSIAAIVFGIFWTIIAAVMTSDSPFGIIGLVFPLFGVIFIVMGIIQAVYHYKNATGKDRFSIIDITDSSEEGDPSDKWIKRDTRDEEGTEKQKTTGSDFNYCPYCREQLEKSDYVYCPKCGKTL